MSEQQRVRQRARRRIRWAAVLGLTLIGLSAGAYFGFYRALQFRPGFYRHAVALPTNEQRQAGQDFERNVLGLHNDLQESGQWQRVFHDEQINGWLAVDLPEKFPKLLPPEIQEPRIALTPDQLQIAFQYTGERLSTVVVLTLHVALADENNALAVRVSKAQAGWVPLPLKDFLDHITDAARRANILLRWAQMDGDPVAIITLPQPKSEDPKEAFLLEMISIDDGEMTIIGSARELGDMTDKD